MNVFRVTSILLLLIFVCSTTSCLNNDRGSSSSGPNSDLIRRNRRNGLNEFLVPPPRPKSHPPRSGRVANSPEAPGYFSQLMSWLNPFNYGSSSGTSLKPPHAEVPYPPPPQPHGLSPQPHGPPPQPHGPPPQSHGPPSQSHGPPPQPHGPPPFNLHPNPFLHSSPARGHPSQGGAPLYPPLGPPPPALPSAQAFQVPPGIHSAPTLLSLPPPGPSLSVPSDLSLNLPPVSPPNLHAGPPLQLYGVQAIPSSNFHDVHHALPPPLPPLKDNRGLYAPTNKGKPCNSCNKVPWIPMQGGGFPEVYTHSSQLSNGYLPPSNPGNHDIQHAATHEIRVPDYSQVSVNQNVEPNLPNPSLYPEPLAPVYKAEAFNDPSQSSSNAEHEEYLQPPLLSTILPNQAHKNLGVNGDHYNLYGNDDQKSTGSNNQDHISAIPENYEREIDKGPGEHKELIGSVLNDPVVSSISGQSFNQDYHIDNPAVANQENGGGLNQPDRYNQGILTSFGSSNGANHDFANGNGNNDYHESFNSNHNINLNNNPPIVNQESGGVLNQPIQHGQNVPTSYGSSNLANHDFTNGNPSGYQESFKSSSSARLNTDLNYLSPDLNPSISFGSSSFHGQNVESLNSNNYQYSDDLSPSSSVVKDSHATTQAAFTTTFAPKESPIHYEESPLLDLTKKGESRTDTQWPTSTVGYTDIAEVSDSTLKTTTDYNIETDNIFFEDSSNFVKSTEEPYSTSDIQNINNAFEPAATRINFLKDNKNVETSTIASTRYANQQDVSYIPPLEQPGFLWPSLLLNSSPNLRNQSSKSIAPLDHLTRWNNSFEEIKISGNQDRGSNKDAKDTVPKQQNAKRNKQVQVIIPYTSDFTPIPFQQSYGDWSVKTNLERTQARKVPPRGEPIADNYLQQESRNDIRVVNQLQSQFNFNESNKSNAQSIRPSLNAAEESRSGVTKGNNSIDVRRLQKNIDNWTIQEYSKPTTSSTILPSSLHPYLSPSKKIPTEYLTTTEPGDHTKQSKDHNESVKTYSLAGFSFNEVEHEVSASNRIEETQAPVNAVRIEKPKATASSLHSENNSRTEEKSTWKAYSVSISPVNRERVYVVTPQPVPESKNAFEKQKGDGKGENSQRPTTDSTVADISHSKNNLSEFEAIEKAYQVLPQAVNNLAVASTGKENVPLWGIMEHEEFASLNLDENEEDAEDAADGPVLYSGHSKVSRAKR